MERPKHYESVPRLDAHVVSKYGGRTVRHARNGGAAGVSFGAVLQLGDEKMPRDPGGEDRSRGFAVEPRGVAVMQHMRRDGHYDHTLTDALPPGSSAGGSGPSEEPQAYLEAGSNDEKRLQNTAMERQQNTARSTAKPLTYASGNKQPAVSGRTYHGAAAGATVASATAQMADAEGVAKTAPAIHNEGEAKTEAIKFNTLVSQAEAEAGLPDTTQTTEEPVPPPSEEDEEESLILIIAIVLVVIVGVAACGWSVYASRQAEIKEEMMLRTDQLRMTGRTMQPQL